MDVWPRQRLIAPLEFTAPVQQPVVLFSVQVLLPRVQLPFLVHLVQPVRLFIQLPQVQFLHQQLLLWLRVEPLLRVPLPAGRVLQINKLIQLFQALGQLLVVGQPSLPFLQPNLPQLRVQLNRRLDRLLLLLTEWGLRITAGYRHWAAIFFAHPVQQLKLCRQAARRHSPKTHLEIFQKYAAPACVNLCPVITPELFCTGYIYGM